jgi:hypothetical protein
MNAGLQESVQKFIEHHVFRHTGSTDVWNVPFYHVNELEWLRYDSVMLGVVVLLLCALGFQVRRRYQTIPKGFAALVEMYVLFIRDHIVYANMGEVVGRRFVSFFCTLFARGAGLGHRVCSAWLARLVDAADGGHGNRQLLLPRLCLDDPSVLQHAGGAYRYILACWHDHRLRMGRNPIARGCGCDVFL